jgi:FHA domain
MPNLSPSSVDPQWLYAGGGLVAVVLFVGVVSLIRGVLARRALRALEPSEPPPLVIPVHRRGAAEIPLQPLRRVTPRQIDEVADIGQTGDLSVDLPPVPANGYVTNGTRRTDKPAASAIPVNGSGPITPPNGTVSASVGNTAARVIQEVAPVEGTLQFLPGRLEIVDGDVPGRDIRFVRTWGEIPEVTFGRVAGPPYRHVQLRSQTVSRQHARMQFADGRWKLINLSQTNPVVVNGEPLDTAHGQRVLRDGDEIEMGDVLFRFRER